MFRKKEFHVGDQFGPNRSSSGISVSHNTKKEHIKSLLLNYGRALKSAYFGKHDKKQMRSKMSKLNQELKRLEKEEAIAEKKFQISQKRQKIAKLTGSTVKTKSFADNFTIPDVMGSVKGNIGMTKLNLPGSGSNKGTRLNLPGGGHKTPRYI